MALSSGRPVLDTKSRRRHSRTFIPTHSKKRQGSLASHRVRWRVRISSTRPEFIDYGVAVGDPAAPHYVDIMLAGSEYVGYGLRYVPADNKVAYAEFTRLVVHGAIDDRGTAS